MRTFAPKQNQPQERVSSRLARSEMATRRTVHRDHLDLLYLQRTIGNQALQRMLQTNAEEPKAGLTGTMPPRFGVAGNAATASPLRDAAGAKAIPREIGARMTQSFGVDLRGVRVRDDSAARNRANALNAKAFVEGGQIHWGDSAPRLESPEAAPLLAHEISHVVQQRQASSLEDRISSPGEASEVAANTAASRVLAGQTASGGGGSAAAATQRQPKNDMSADPADKEIEIEMIAAYLQKVVSTSPPQNLKTAQVVRDALKMLVAKGGSALASNATIMDVDKFVDAAGTPSDPAGMAKLFAEKLPPLRKAALDMLLSFPFIDKQASTVDRVGDLVKKSKAGGPTVTPVPGEVSPQDKSDDINRRMGGPATHSIDLDISRYWRIAKGLGTALNPKPTKAAAPQADLDPTVTKVIDTIDKDALRPAEAKGQVTGEWADGKLFAADVAQKLDVAQKSNQEQIIVKLSSAYAGVDRAAIKAAMEAIINKLRDALPQHASNVKRVIVYVDGSKAAWLVITQ